jgi:hypothetical protein
MKMKGQSNLSLGNNYGITHNFKAQCLKTIKTIDKRWHIKRRQQERN